MSFLFSKKPQPPKELIKKFEQMGFDKKVTKNTWKLYKGDEKKMLDHLVNLNQPQQTMPMPMPTVQPVQPLPYKEPPVSRIMDTFATNNNIERNNINKAIQLSLAAKEPVYEHVIKPSYEPLNAEQRVRPEGLPVGLKNVGNTCYVNSLFQAYFMSETFVSSILRYDPRVTLVDGYLSSSSPSKGEEDAKRKRIEASIKLIKNLQKLFAKMIKSHKKYVDPTEVLDSVVDDMGVIVTVGNQRDITEYHLNFLSRIEDAFYYQDKFLEAIRDDEIMPIQLKDLPESYSATATLRNQFLNEVLFVSENSVITNHFFGRMKQIMTFTQNDEQVTEEKDLVLGPIILDVLNRDLYTALETYCNFTIDDYQTPNGEVTSAKGQIWITKPPELLFVQLNRVSYDKNTNMPVKMNKMFEFEKEIYLDRFLLDCRDEAHLINRRIASLKTELTQKENALQKLLTCFESRTNILHVFDFMEDFLKKQINFEGSPSSRDADPTVVGMVEEKEKINAATEVITTYKMCFESKMAELRNSIATIKSTINKLWSKLNKRKYHLVSILIHEGDAESGHYYSFNRNVQKDTWKRFNDHNVSEEKEEVVLTEAIGGYANMNAYCLVYLSDDNIQEEINLNTTELKDLFNTNTREEVGVEVEKDYYKKLLTPALTQEVVADNLAFQDEVEEFQSTAYIRSVVEKYKSRYNLIAKPQQTKNSSSPPVHLNSFANFLKADSYCDGALKWYILDSVLQESQEAPQMKNYPKLNLKTLKNFPELFLKAQKQLKALPKPFTLSSLTLTSQIENQLEIKLAEYASEFPVFTYATHIVKSFLRENWQEACYAIQLFLNAEKNEKAFLFKLVRDCSRVASLFMALKIESYMKTSQVEESFRTMTYLLALVKGLIKSDETHMYQIRTILLEIMSESQEFITEEDRIAFKEHFRRFTQGPHSISELEKVNESYDSDDLRKILKGASQQDLYSWRVNDEQSPSNIIRKLVEKFRYNLPMIVEFHNQISQNKNVVNSVERKRLGFVIY